MWKRDMRHETRDVRHENLKSQVSRLESIPDVFKITEKTEELPDTASTSLNDSNLVEPDTREAISGKRDMRQEGLESEVSSLESPDMVERLESLRAEILKLGKAQIQTRMFAESEYRALREAIQEFFAGNDHVAEMVIEDLFSIADGLEAGIRAGGAISSPEMGSWLDGMKIVHQRVMELLEKFDVYPLHSVGKLFDPSLQVAVAVEHLQEVDDNIILEEQRRGYTRGDKVIRYAEVVVNKQPRESAVWVEETNE